MIAAAPTGRAARELRERAAIEGASTLARLRIHLARCGGFSRRTVLIIDEAGMASTRESAAVITAAAAAGAKVVAIGDSGQLASVEAGGWLGSLRRRYGAHELTEVMRQRDREERRLLARVHARRPAAYLRRKRERGELEVHANPRRAEEALVAEWRARSQALSAGESVMIARDNATRDRLNSAARRLLEAEDRLGESIDIGGRAFAVGDRVIVRRNDRYHDVDNGMRGTVQAIDVGAGTITVETDASGKRTLPWPYVTEHLEHAYALTGHGMQGGTVEWACAIGAPGEFTANWSYTALSRGREPTRIYLIAEDERFAAERIEIGPPDQHALSPIQRMAAAMRRRDDEDLALDRVEPPELPRDDRSISARSRPEGERSTVAARAAHVRAALERPGPHLDRALGPRPPAGPQRRIWERGALAIERYRFDHGIRGPSPLGDRPATRRAEAAHRRAQRELELANRRLGRELSRISGREL